MTVAFPQVLLCILAVVAIFIFILATLICCLLRFVGPYSKLDNGEKSWTSDGDEDELVCHEVKPILIYQTKDQKADIIR